MVPHASAQSWAVGLAPLPGAEERDPVAGRRLVVAEVDHELVHADPPAHRSAPVADQHLGAVAGVARHAVAVPHRHDGDRRRRGRRARCGRRRRPAPASIRLTMARSAAADIAGTSPRSGVRPGAGSRPYDAMPQRTRSKRELGPQDRGGGVGEVARPRGAARPRSATSSASPEGGLLRVVGGVVRLVGAGEVRPDAGDGPVAALLAGRGPRRRRRPRSRARRRRGRGRCRP